MWLTVFTMLMGATGYALCLSFAVNVFSTTDHPSRMYYNGLEVLNEYMRVRSLPKALRERLRTSFEHQYPNKRIFSERAVLGEFGYPLRNEIRVAQCASLFTRSPIFRDADQALLSMVAARLQLEVALVNDWLAREGEVLKYIVFIDTGLVEVPSAAQHVHTHTPLNAHRTGPQRCPARPHTHTSHAHRTGLVEVPSAAQHVHTHTPPTHITLDVVQCSV